MSAASDDVRLARGQAAAAAVDAHGVVTAWSTGARELLGYLPTEVVGEEAEALLAEPLPIAAKRCCTRREAWDGLITLRHRDGRGLHVRLQAQPLLNAVGEAHWFLTVTAPEASGETSARAGREPDPPNVKQWALEQLPLPVALFDRQGSCFAVNAAVTVAMGKPEKELLGVRIGHSGPGQPMKGLEGIAEAAERVWRSGETARLEVHLRTPGESRPHAWLLSLYPVMDPAGHVCALSQAAADTTEQFQARQWLSVLNDAGLRIGTTLDLSRTADELAEVGSEYLADFVVVDLLDGALSGAGLERAPSGDPLVLRRTAQRSVLPGCPEAVVPIGGIHTYHAESPPGRALTLGRASRHQVDDATLTAWAAGCTERAESIRTHKIHSLMAVPLRARGTSLGIAVFCRHRTPESFDEQDLRLAEDLVARAAVYIDNARRYTREREIALALQNRLMPDRMIGQSAVEVASRYLPADPDVGIGGVWFDVIPLSGARVALVVGDVAGRGIQASATMGRLCTAVRTLADVDLAPDELLTQLDDLVLRLDREETANGTHQALDSGMGEVGATCLYAVYDPISRLCSMARAGHPVPAMVTPDGAVDFLDLPAGPPLGLGGLPFEVAEFEVPEGSVLALYTDGLIENAHHEAYDGYANFRAVLASPHRPLEETCDRALKILLPGHRTDDAALLLARTHVLGADQVATWELSADPATVAHARELVCDVLTTWHLEDLTFVFELIASELVTNAIRYARPPIQLRLIRDINTVICEVSDASSTAPHLRRARVYDEGGRGLLIVAQLAQRWGSRHTGTGKTIWAEVPLPGIASSGEPGTVE
ncbi:PAS domain-containing SpoIIE family protein phosphatase/ATP-binding protein [Streptomyces sp. A3M-1-3]|uniref:ATP-binding SpoIIE family protein phosphatase n=1 Tax=Streptomyces sp. A3M-1-3 TaxID=2962044 RepID=UPI0020B663A5|nr:SpoIIE family protein phosphatase [Streptomyces sp. A3M-1-3]MCP3820547.1 PAS domain-containing SpoIIE family protein phosphatase/ATP-binding protein [Streptomyces sp. A3M-1-3]